MTEQDDFTSKQNDYAIFLPAISGFYATFIGRQRNEQYVDPARMPSGLKDMEQLNWLNSQKSLFPYRWSLYSAGHANLDLNKQDWSEDMVRNRASDTFMLGDSGGFQIAKGRWPGEWRDPTSTEVQNKLASLRAQGTKTVLNKKGKVVTVNPAAEYQKLLDDAENKRRLVLNWLDGIADYSMTLDIPTWVTVDKRAGALCGVNTVQEAIDATKYNNEYFIRNRRGRDNGGTRILNVLQGDSHSSADEWYETMKHYCDPTQYPGRHFDGWAMGGQNMCDVELVLKRLVALKYDNLLQPGIHDWMHFLGTSRLEWAVLLTALQRTIRKYVNPNFTISFDCASPFLATANGQIYHEIDLPHEGKWTYRMSPGIDDKKYANDTRSMRDVYLQDFPKDYQNFEESPISALCQIKDICIYQQGDLNKLGKEGRTSWDSFSYALQMAHNVWMHIKAVQEANTLFDTGQWPSMLRDNRPNKEFFVQLIDRIFSANTRSESEKIISQYTNYWPQIIGTRGNVGKKVWSTNTTYNQFFK